MLKDRWGKQRQKKEVRREGDFMPKSLGLTMPIRHQESTQKTVGSYASFPACFGAAVVVVRAASFGWG